MKEYFPKEPYSIQLQIAFALLDALKQETIKLAIIESPTGTGKTYSLLAPILMWLRHNKSKIGKQQQKQTLPSWLKKPKQQKGQRLLNNKLKSIEQMINISSVKQQMKKRKINAVKSKSNKDVISDEDHEINSDEDVQHKNKKNIYNNENVLIEKQLKIEDKNVLPKLIYVSRTHSQLSQVLDSLKEILKQSTDLKCLQIASKQHLCVNPDINKQKSNINQRCQYILDHSSCPYHHQFHIKDYFDKHVEDSLKLGQQNSLCSYFGIRNLIQYADILCVPYTSILNSDIRNKIGINIHNSIIVFDQGHNLVQFEKQLHSPQISIADIQALSKQVDQYLSLYQEKLKIKNVKLLQHLLQILRHFLILYQKYKQKRDKKNNYMKLDYLGCLLQLNLKQIKIQKIIKYIQLNNVDKKLSFFNVKKAQKTTNGYAKNNGVDYSKSLISVGKINNVLNFLQQFTKFDNQRQIIIIKWSEHKGSFKILCLESEQLKKIVSMSRMTIIAGGTMQPLQQLKELFKSLNNNILIKKYNHIIKQQQLKINIIKKFNGKQILINRQTTTLKQHFHEFAQICKFIINKVLQKTQKGGGIIIFIQNYRVIQLFKLVITDQVLYQKIFFDDKQGNVFQAYKKKVQTDTTSNYILVSVMGGKLSQGINFTDRLARSILVFGLPYPNLLAPQIIQNMKYYDQKHSQTFKGKQYYENLCVKCLNQSIGRGIRHINDYVNIYLIDHRFDGLKDKLSSWMKNSITIINEANSL